MGLSGRAGEPATGAEGGAGLPIGEIARRVGLTPRTIRYYEDIGLLSSVRRVEGGRRVYTEEDIQRLQFITRLKVLGLSLDEVRDLEELYLTHGSNTRLVPKLLGLLNRHLGTIESRIEELHALKRDIETYRAHLLQKV